MYKALVVITAILSVTGLMVVALALGYNSNLLTGVIAAIFAASSGFVMYYTGKNKGKKEVEK